MASIGPLRLLALSLLATIAAGQYYPFCTTGLQRPPHFADDLKVPSVSIIFAQAPLFSTNPKIGPALGYLNLYHTSIVLAQGSGNATRYWTLEFDFTGGSIVTGGVPKIDGDVLTWNNDARFCLTDGLLWGREHWTKQFETLAVVTARQAASIFDDFVYPLNGTAPRGRPQYQPWRVTSRSTGERLVRDVTCADGATWFVHYVSSVLKMQLPATFDNKNTAVFLEVDRIAVVNTSDHQEWKEVVTYYRRLSDAVGKVPLLERLEDIWNLALGRKFVYDTNEKVYYEIFGDPEPGIRLEYTAFPLEAPPWSRESWRRPTEAILV